MIHSSARIAELDGVRGLACLFVLIHHYFTGVNAYALPSVVAVAERLVGALFLSGVDLFYVLSGFLVGGIIIDHYRSSNFLRVFFVCRACRIFPVYFALIASLVVGLYFLRGHSFFDLWLLERPLPIWSYLTFTQSYIMGFANASGPKWAAVSWSVSVEEQFYLLTPFLFLLLRARGVLRLLALGLVIAPFLRLYFYDHYGFYAAYMMFPGRFDTILWGILLAYIVRNNAWRNWLANRTWLPVTIALIAYAIITLQQLSIIPLHHAWFFSLIAIFYTCSMWLVLAKKLPALNRALTARWLMFTGYISFGMYMYHQLINGLMHGHFFTSAPRIESLASIGVTLVSILVVYLVSYASYRYFETPIRNWGTRFKYADARGSAPLPKA